MNPESPSRLFAHPGDLSEPLFWLLPAACAVLAGLICLAALARGRLPRATLAAGLVFLPLAAFGLSYATLMERSKSTQFCASCHIMEPIRASSRANDGSLASFHVSSGAVPTAKSCYTCHAGYGLWGDVGAKLAGMGHMIATLRNSYEFPLAMNRPYDINACLACHAESRSFHAVEVHAVPEIERALLAREMSCSGTCHPAAHPAGSLTGGGES